MAEILVLDVCARRLSAAGDCFCGVSTYQAMRQHTPVFPPVSPVLRPVFFIGLFLRYFNDLSCIWGARPPVNRLYFFAKFFTERAAARA
jgi:hypothetical protein